MEKISIHKSVVSRFAVAFKIHKETLRAYQVFNFKNELFWIPKKALVKCENSIEYRLKEWFTKDNKQVIDSLFNN